MSDEETQPSMDKQHAQSLDFILTNIIKRNGLSVNFIHDHTLSLELHDKFHLTEEQITNRFQELIEGKYIEAFTGLHSKSDPDYRLLPNGEKIMNSGGFERKRKRDYFWKILKKLAIVAPILAAIIAALAYFKK